MLELTWGLGLAAAGAATLQGLYWGASEWARWRGDRRQAALERQLLQAQIDRLSRAGLTDSLDVAGWNGWRVFEVTRRVEEQAGVVSLYLAPHDRKALPRYKPGQYLTFQFRVPQADKPPVRCYSLSDAYHPEQYRVSIKRIDAPPGLVSQYVHARVHAGALLDVRAPAGHFFLDLESVQPIVLLGGGVGITPLLSMLNAVAARGDRRETWLFYGVRNPSEVIQQAHLEALARQHDWFHLHLCYSDATPAGSSPGVHQHAGRVSVELLKQVLPSNNYGYYICGPGPMMQSLTEGLKSWGVPDDDVHFEAFGPASVKKTTPAATTSAASNAPSASIKVEFQRSGKSCDWTPEAGALLDLAERHGVPIDSGCRAGNCGTCLVAIRSGEVEYTHEPGYEPDAGTCLTCVARPRGPIVLEA